MTVVKQCNDRLFFVERIISRKFFIAAVILHILCPADRCRRNFPRLGRLWELFCAAIFTQDKVQHIEDIRIVGNVKILAYKRIISHITHFSGHNFAHCLSH